MAFAVQILFFKEGEKIAKKVFEPIWWNIIELKEKYNFKFDLDMVIQDYLLDLDISKLKKIHEQQMIYVKAKNKLGLELDSKVDELNRLIESASLYKKITIKIFECESGM